MMKTEQTDVVIIGGGLVGMCLAIACARENIRVVVIDRTAWNDQLADNFDGRVSAIARGSMHLLQHTGIWQRLKETSPIHDIRVSDGASPFFLHYDCDEVNADSFGHIVENRHLRQAMQEEAKQYPHLKLYALDHVVRTERSKTGVEVRLASGQEFRAQLLVAADGKHSILRKQAGIATLDWKYDHSAIVCTIEHEKPHHGLAQERFLPIGPFAVLPMTGNRSSLVWTEPNERMDIYMELPDEEFNQEIAERVGGYLGTLKAVGPRYRYPLSLSHAMRYVDTRLALIGDAAHAIHPIAGQGVNLGYRDVAVLAELLGDAHRTGQDLGDAALLQHYQRWRRFDNTMMVAVTDGLTRLFSNNILPLKMARGLGLWTVGRMPAVKRFFMRHAMGAVGDVPRLMQPMAGESENNGQGRKVA